MSCPKSVKPSVFTIMQDLYEKDSSSEKLADMVRTLFDLGLVMTEGRSDDPAGFGQRVARLLSAGYSEGDSE